MLESLQGLSFWPRETFEGKRDISETIIILFGPKSQFPWNSLFSGQYRLHVRNIVLYYFVVLRLEFRELEYIFYQKLKKWKQKDLIPLFWFSKSHELIFQI